MRLRPAIVIIAAAAYAGCGRREERAFFDASAAAKPPVTAAAIATPLPPEAARVHWDIPDVPREVPAGHLLTVPITFTNLGPPAWPDNTTANPQTKDGSYAVRLAHRWLAAGQPLVPRTGGERTDLLRTVAPHETMTMRIAVRAPDAPGDYRLVVEFLQELVEWFADVGGDTLTIPIRVVPAATAPAPPR